MYEGRAASGRAGGNGVSLPVLACCGPMPMPVLSMRINEYPFVAGPHPTEIGNPLQPVFWNRTETLIGARIGSSQREGEGGPISFRRLNAKAFFRRGASRIAPGLRI
jgi:hypothetical protein